MAGQTGEEAGKYFRGKKGRECHLKILEGINYFELMSIEGNNTSRRIAGEVVAMCPENPCSYIILGWVAGSV